MQKPSESGTLSFFDIARLHIIQNLPPSELSGTPPAVLKLLFRQMFSIKFLKIFLFIALFASACRFWQAKGDVTPSPTPVNIEEISGKIPFPTKEPDVFQTEIITTANGVEDKIFTARNGENYYTIYDFQKKSEFALLQTAANGSILIARNQKIYTENQTTNDDQMTDDFPTAELLNEKPNAKYESLGAENGYAKYRIVLNDSANSEIVVTVDRNINLPVKQEFYNISGDRKTLVSTTELKNYNEQPDAQNFEIPKDYKKVSADEFQQILRRERTK